MPEPRNQEEYASRQVEAARRVIVDVMQVLAAYQDCLVLVGGWVPELLIEQSEEPHTGSIDVDLALDTEHLQDGRYADMLKALLATQRYDQGEKRFQFVTEVDLQDGEVPVSVEVDFLAPRDARTRKGKSKHIEGFQVLKADGCGAAFLHPHTLSLEGQMVNGAVNTVSLQVASLPDFLIMKAFALNGRDKPKDAYDICFCLDHAPGGVTSMAADWAPRRVQEPDVERAITILKKKFPSPDAFGPMQVVEFHNHPVPETRDQQSRRAYELVRAFLNTVEDLP
jgi:predicted nucleotidyltransferase